MTPLCSLRKKSTQTLPTEASGSLRHSFCHGTNKKRPMMLNEALSVPTSLAWQWPTELLKRRFEIF